MPDAARIVLGNTVVVRSNPWLRLWNEATADAGLELRELSLGEVVASRPVAGVHLQWPERVLSPVSAREAARRTARLLVLSAVVRLRRGRVLFTVHNVTAHDSRHPRLEALLWAALPVLVTDVHLMSSAGRPEVIARHPRLARRRWHVIPHGHYGPVVGEGHERGSARRSLGRGLDEDSVVLTSVGALLPYKGLGALVRAFRDLDDDRAVLLLAGRTTPEDAAELVTASEGDVRVDVDPSTIDDDELSRRIAASDLVVLPYRRVLNSGSAFLALTAGRPVLVPETPTFAELSERVGPGWVHLFEGDLTSADLVAAMNAGAPVHPPDLSWCEWPDISRSIAEMWNRP